MKSRTEHVLRNARVGVMSKCISLILNFIARTVFLRYLGATYLGINGLYAEILQILNFTELGIGEALTFAMYSPVAKGDDQKTIQLLSIYKKAYRYLAVFVAVLGIATMPFLHLIIKGAEELSLFQLRSYFVFYLANTVLSYFVADKFSYVNALQLKYIITKTELITNTTTIVLQIFAVVLFKNYSVFLAIQTLVLLVSKIVVTIYLKAKYPILTKKSNVSLDIEDRKRLVKDIKGLAIHKFSSVAVHATDNIIISSFTSMGVVLVGYISNYNLIINSIIGFVVVVFSSMTASFGNLVAASSKERYRSAFLEVNFLNFWVYGFCSIAFFVLIPPFLTIWIGSEYLIDTVSFLLIVMNCYLQGQSSIYNYARDASGHFHIDKWWSFLQAIVNLAVSLVCVSKVGLVGVYIGTVVSRIVYIIGKPISTYCFLFGKSVIEYFVYLTKYFVSTVLAGAITYYVTQCLFHSETLLTLIGKGFIVLILPNLIFCILFFKSKEFIGMKQRIRGLLRRKRSE